ncbi:uncharacterized protein BDZ83DRAFT_783077 [Colletotrichum acutatum]|uniref:Uncharacterized protein n=1 Tax=Glomerella acutata TaxID=27357 RepID=A0AAD8UGK7_GLOAC|nr:uncharacterized protein BDZ83DRAFT_783077 [Colletotrichum acutatum]KAK1722748.1 hypothetical protein BDZ83DRAFT_783077 [Colletotrichum acutatum]
MRLKSHNSEGRPHTTYEKMQDKTANLDKEACEIQEFEFSPQATSSSSIPAKAPYPRHPSNQRRTNIMIDPFSVALAFAGMLVIFMALSYLGSLIYQLFRDNGLFDPKSIGCLTFVIFILASIHPLTGDRAHSVLFSVSAVVLEAVWGLKIAVIRLRDTLRRAFASRQPASNTDLQQVALRQLPEQTVEQPNPTPAQEDPDRCYRQREVCDNAEQRLTKTLRQSNSYASEVSELDAKVLELQHAINVQQSRAQQAENRVREANARLLAHETDGATIARLEAELEYQKAQAHDADVCREASNSQAKYLQKKIDTQKEKFQEYARRKEDQIGVLRTDIKALQRQKDSPPRVELLATGPQSEAVETAPETAQQYLEEQLAITQARLTVNQALATSATFERFISKTQMDDLKADSQNTEQNLLIIIVELRKELAKAQAQATTATQWQVTQQNIEASTSGDILALQTDLANIKAEAKATIESQGAQIQEAAGFKAEAERVVADLRSEAEQLRRENDNYKQKVEQMAALRPQIALLQQEAEQIRVERNALQQQVEQLMDQATQIAPLQQERDVATRKVQLVEQQAVELLQAKAVQVTKLEVDLRTVRKEKKKAEEEIKGYFQELEEEQERLRKSLESEKAAIKTMSDLKVANDDFCAETERLNVEVQRLLNENTNLTARMKKFANEELLKANMAKKNKTQELNNKDGILVFTKKTHEDELEKKEAELAEKNEKIAKLESQYSMSCAGRLTLRDKTKKGREDLTLLASRVRDLEGQIRNPKSGPRLTALQTGSVSTVLQQIEEGKHLLSLTSTPEKKPERAQSSSDAKPMRPMKPLPNRRRSEQLSKSEAGPSSAMEGMVTIKDTVYGYGYGDDYEILLWI